MNVAAEPTTAGIGKGQDDQCQAVGQQSFASPTGCRLSTVAYVFEVLRQATATLTS